MKALLKPNWNQGFELAEVPLPVPDEGEVRVKVRGAAICGSDLHIYESAPGYEWLSLPVIPGHETMGVVELLGPGVDTRWLGRRIIVNPYIPCGKCRMCRSGQENLCDGGKTVLDKIPSQSLQIGFRRPGGMAERLIVPVSNLLPIDDSISDEAASMMESFAVCVHAVERVRLPEHGVALVIGPGPIGLGTVAALSVSGLDEVLVAGLEVDTKRLEIASRLGATRTVDTSRESLLKVVQEITQGQGVDVVFDCSGHPDGLSEAITAVRRGGVVVLVGIYGRPAPLPANAVVRGEVSVVGTYGTTPRAFQRAIDLVAGGEVDLSPMITHVVSLSDAEAGFCAALSKQGCKVVLQP